MSYYPMPSSLYLLPPGATGDACVYGAFPGQSTLGHLCDVSVSRLDDDDPIAVDLLGYGGVFRRSGIAIHISGLDPFGRRTGPGVIRALGMYAVAWRGATDHPAGLGCYQPEPAAILTWDGDAGGRAHCSGEWQHYALYGGCRSIVTLAGVLMWWREHSSGAFDAQEVCAWLDRERGGVVRYSDRQYVAAVRRLLNTSVGVQNNGLAERGAVLVRAGRWSWTWEVER